MSAPNATIVGTFLTPHFDDPSMEREYSLSFSDAFIGANRLALWVCVAGFGFLPVYAALFNTPVLVPVLFVVIPFCVLLGASQFVLGNPDLKRYWQPLCAALNAGAALVGTFLFYFYLRDQFVYFLAFQIVLIFVGYFVLRIQLKIIAPTSIAYCIMFEAVVIVCQPWSIGLLVLGSAVWFILFMMVFASNMLETSDRRLFVEHRAKEYLKDRAEASLAELKKAQTQIIAQEKLASLGSLTAGIAHEIKNPLNFINNYAESSVEFMEELDGHLAKVLPREGGSEVSDIEYLMGELKQNMRDILKHGRRGDHIVQSMLMHSRSGLSTFTPESIDTLAEECLNLAYHGFRAKNNGLLCEQTFHAVGDLEKIDIVRGDLSRTLINLCTNAFWSVHNKRSGAPTDWKGRVEVTVRHEDRHIRIDVRDNGIGISPQARERLFQPFFTTKPTGEGTGLGLSMSRQIVVEELGGQLLVESEEGEGACFSVILPIHQPRKESAT